MNCGTNAGLSRLVGLLAAIVVGTIPAHAAGRPLVLVTMPDMAAIVQAVAGDLVEMQVVLPPGSDPHDFTISAAQVRSFGRSELVIYAASSSHEFEAAIKSALRDKPSLDWDDYAARGAALHDYPGYPRNPHAPWLRLDNAVAIARAVAGRLAQIGLPAAVLQARLQAFEQELAAQRQAGLRVVQERGLSGRPMLAMIPGVCDVIANFGVPVGEVAMAEGSGTVAGRRLQEAVAQLRRGAYSAIVCPLSMRQSKQGEAARQIASDSGAPIVYVHFLDTRPGQDTYLSQMADNTAALAAIDARGVEPKTSPATTGARLLAAGLLGLLLGIVIGRRLSRPRAPSCGAGIFDR